MPATAAFRYAVRLGAHFGAIFLFIGIFMPYFPAWLDAHGFSATQIALIVGLPIILRVPVTLAIGVGADALGQRRMPIVALIALSLLVAFTFILTDRFWPVLLASSVLMVAFGAIIPLSDAMALTGPARVRAAYGRIRLWGSLTFIAANVLCGYHIARSGADVVPVWVVVSLMLAFGLSLMLPETSSAGSKRRLAFRRRLREGLRLLRQPAFAIMILAFGAVQSSNGMYYGFSVIHWRSLGISDTYIGGLWALGVMAEVVLFVFALQVNSRLGPAGLISLGAVAGIARWSITAADPPLAVLAVAQIGHAFTYGATHLGGMYFIERAVPDELAATAQGVLHAISYSVLGGVVILASGPIYAAFAGKGFLVMAVLCAVGFFLASGLRKIWRGGVIL